MVACDTFERVFYDVERKIRENTFQLGTEHMPYRAYHSDFQLYRLTSGAQNSLYVRLHEHLTEILHCLRHQRFHSGMSDVS